MFSGRPVPTLLKVPFMISVLVIDHHPLALLGCRRIPEDAGIGAICCASDLEVAYRLLLSHHPDDAIADLTFSDQRRRGFGLIRRIKDSAKQAPVLVFSMHDNPAIAAQALEAGAFGYLPKEAPSDEPVNAARRVSTSPQFTCGIVRRGRHGKNRAACASAADVVR
jgi:two-component system, NarL family, invasion response regulator UvrY